MYIIRLPVYPRVRRYLIHQYGPRIYSGEPNYVALLFNSVFSSTAKKARQNPISSKFCLGATYDFIISWHNFYCRDHVVFQIDTIKRFNNAIDKLIKQEMYRWCQHPNASYTETDFNIRNFLAFYAFTEDELPFLNMKRWYFHEKRRIKSRLNPRVDHEKKSILEFEQLLNWSNG